MSICPKIGKKFLKWPLHRVFLKFLNISPFLTFDLVYKGGLFYFLCTKQTLYLGKLSFPSCRPKSDCSIFKFALSQEQINKLASIFACWCKRRTSKMCFENFSFGVVKNGCCYALSQSDFSVFKSAIFFLNE